MRKENNAVRRELFTEPRGGFVAPFDRKPLSLVDDLVCLLNPDIILPRRRGRNAEGRAADTISERFDAGEMRALAQLITMVENRAPESSAVIERIYPKTGHAQVVGITGPPGRGQIDAGQPADREVSRASGKKIAILAIDPSSPFSGGAVLGDRVRMTDHYKDTGVYIRSLASRGSHGGLSRAAREIVKLLDAFGSDVIIIETVGVGQTELSIMDLADTTVVVTVPEGGDGVQVMKAGLNEIADVFVVNKADREGADRVKAELELSVHLRSGDGWRPPVLLTQAAADKGVDAVVDRNRETRRIPAANTSMRRASPSAARANSSKC